MLHTSLKIAFIRVRVEFWYRMTQLFDKLFMMATNKFRNSLSVSADALEKYADKIREREDIDPDSVDWYAINQGIRDIKGNIHTLEDNKKE